MLIKTVELGKEVNALNLFYSMRNSKYMRNRNYKVFYATPCYEEFICFDAAKFRVIPVIERIITSYALCFGHSKKNYIININIPADRKGMTPKFHYWIASGDDKELEDDINNDSISASP